MPKYKYIVREILNNGGLFYALIPLNGAGGLLIGKALEVVKFKIWAMINGFNPTKCKLLFNPEDVVEDAFLLVSYIGNFTSYSGIVDSSGLVQYLNRVKGKIILNMNHYPYHPTIGSKSIKSLRFHYFWAENNLRKNSCYFRTHFSDFKQPFIVAAFAVRDKFSNKRAFLDRNLKAIAVGSVSLKMSDDTDFIKYFKHENLQPIRNELFNGVPEMFKEIVISHVSHINDGGAVRPVRAAPNLVSSIKNWIHNVFKYGQRNYHSLNMCELFNNYSIHIVGEEVVGMPGIGFAEGMMCGSVFDDPMYTDLGMEPNKHYLVYNGNYLSLLQTVQSSLQNRDMLKAISEAGADFACKNFKEKIVFNYFCKQIT